MKDFSYPIFFPAAVVIGKKGEANVCLWPLPIFSHNVHMRARISRARNSNSHALFASARTQLNPQRKNSEENRPRNYAALEIVVANRPV